MESKGHKVLLRQEQFILIIITTLMQRILQTYSTQPQSIFIDSSASCDQVNTSLTLVLIATKAGAVPTSVSLHDSQTKASYTVFSQLRESWAAISPIQLVSIMTDDAAAMKNALASVWPRTRQPLCLFHVLQALWR